MTEFIETLYRHFNAREIDEVLAQLTYNVQWANGMEGGYVYGRDAVRQYWERQFTMVSVNVHPITIDMTDGRIVVRVRQVVLDLDNALLSDTIVQHIFGMTDDRIAEFHIGKMQ